MLHCSILQKSCFALSLKGHSTIQPYKVMKQNLGSDSQMQIQIQVQIHIHILLTNSGHPNLEINIVHISYSITFYPLLFHFHISCLD